MKFKFTAACLIFVIIASVCNALSPYANDFPYQKYGFKHEGSQSDSEGTRFFKNKLRDQDGRLKSNNDLGQSYHLDSTQNSHDLQQTKRGGTQDNLSHVQGENFETDKSHKRKHIKSGFQNSYHKDENGSRSSYYEDSDDTGAKNSFDKRQGTRGDQLETQLSEGLRNGLTRDKYDDRKSGYENRDLVDRQFQSVENQGKQHGYNDNHKMGLEDQFEIVRRPYSDIERFRGHDDYYRPVGGMNQQYWDDSRQRMSSYDRDNFNMPNHEMTTRRRITIFEDPRDEFMSSSNPRGGFYQGDNFMTRSEVSRRLDYGPNSNRSPLRLRYRGSRR